MLSGHGNFFKDSLNFRDKFWVFIQGAKVELDSSIIHPNFWRSHLNIKIINMPQLYGKYPLHNSLILASRVLVQIHFTSNLLNICKSPSAGTEFFHLFIPV